MTMVLLRLVILGVVIALGTVLLGWWAVPVAAAAFGALMRSEAWPGTSAAVAAALAWGGYLGIAALGGAPVGAYGIRLAGAMQLPGWAPMTTTLVFPALLAGLASHVGARLGGRYLSSS